jgi:hypothetical protein
MAKDGESVTVHNIAWAIKCFRPLLTGIDIDNIQEEPENQIILLSDFREYIRLGMEDCILTVSRRNFKSNANGFYTFSCREYNGQNLFFLNIYLNNTLYANHSLELRIKRHRAIIHEFTHCIAAFLSIGRILTEKLLEKLIKNLGERARINATDHYQSLLMQFSSGTSTVASALGIYPDEHFRLGYEDFDDSYTALYKNLILDRAIFEKYFIKDLQVIFAQKIKEGNTPEASTVLSQAITSLIPSEAISAEFIKLRLTEELLEYYYRKAV